MFIENKYSHYYYSIVARAKSRNLKGCKDRHHVIPKSFYKIRNKTGWLDGNPDSSDNLVNLTLREHYICHLLLTKFTIGVANQKMWYALNRLINRKTGYQIKSSRMYEHIRKNHANTVSKTLKGVSMKDRCGEDYVARTISDYQKEQIAKSNMAREWSDESRTKMSKSQKQRYLDNPESFPGYSPSLEERKAISKRQKDAANKHTIEHPIFGEFTGSLALLSDTYPDQQLRKDELWRLTIGHNKSYKGWRMVSAIVPKTTRKKKS